MRSLVWKEFRETGRWAALPLLLFGGIMVAYGPRPCINEQWLLLVSLVGAVFGGALGFLQVAGESQGDRRALLLHRPLSRGRIFLAKALVGAGVYLAALGFPFAVNAVLAALPGNVAEPFRWAVLLPWLADILTGLVYYFAGMLSGQRKGRWYAARCLGYPAALLASLLVWNVPEFWQALGVIVAVGGLLAVAAWGSFLTGGEYKPQPLLAKAALALVFLISLTTIGVEAKSLLGAMMADGTFSYYNVDQQGRIVIVEQLPSREMRVTDLDGHDLPQFEPKHLASNDSLYERMAPFTTGGAYRWNGYRTSGRLFIPYANDSTPRGEHWFFVPDRGRVVGFDSRKRPIGSFGPAGYALPGQRTTDRFEGKLAFSSSPRVVYSPEFLAFPGGVYTVDFRRRAVEMLFSPPVGESALFATRWVSHSQDESLIFVCTDNSVHVLDKAGLPLFSAPLAYDLTEFGDVRLRRLENPRRFMISYAPAVYLDLVRRCTLPSHFLEYDVAGQEIGRHSVPGLRFAKVSPWQSVFGLVTPPAEFAFLLAALRDRLFTGPPSAVSDMDPLANFTLNKCLTYLPDILELQLGPRRSAVNAYLLLSVLSAAISAAACFWLARRHAFSRMRQIGWVVCGLLFGPLSLLLMLAIEEWPARIICPACGKRRVVDRDLCEHCSAAHASPTSDGTEIFESEDARSPVAAA